MGRGAPNSDSILGLGQPPLPKAYGHFPLHMFSCKPLGTEGIYCVLGLGVWLVLSMAAVPTQLAYVLVCFMSPDDVCYHRTFHINNCRTLDAVKLRSATQKQDLHVLGVTGQIRTINVV